MLKWDSSGVPDSKIEIKEAKVNEISGVRDADGKFVEDKHDGINTRAFKNGCICDGSEYGDKPLSIREVYLNARHTTKKTGKNVPT